MMKMKIILIFFIFDRVYGESRLLNGKTAKLGQFPYHVQLKGDGGACGGSIIHARWVLTAAHCIHKDVFSHISKLRVVVGTTHIDGIRGKEYQPELAIVHQDYINSDDDVHDDIALIRLETDIQFNKNIKPIKLSRKTSRTYVDSVAVISGFGLLRPILHSSSTPKSLQYIRVKVDELESCRKVFPFVIPSSHICTSTLTGKSTCLGDSGGPVVIHDRQVGIVSFGLGACSKRTPDVHTKVSTFIPWIKHELSYYNDVLP